MIPYKNQNLDYLHGIEQDPSAYRGKVVSFGGEVKGVTEDTRRMRLVIKIDVPFYYYATGKDPLSYELLLISFDKKGMPQMTGIQKGSNIKVLARVANYETRKNLTGKPIAVLHLIAFALADRDREKDFFRPEPPYKQLYESWKAGRLFFDEQPQEIEARYPAPQRKTMTFIPLPPPSEEKKPSPAPGPGIVYDEEEPAFVLPKDPEPEPVKAPEQPPEEPSAEPNTAEPTQETLPTDALATEEQPPSAPQDAAPAETEQNAHNTAEVTPENTSTEEKDLTTSSDDGTPTGEAQVEASQISTGENTPSEEAQA